MSYKDGRWHENYSIFEADDGTFFGSDDSMLNKIGPARQTLDWMQPMYGDSVQKMSNPGGVLAPALLGLGGYILGEGQTLGSVENGMNNIYNFPNSSISKEGPMRFAGRGIEGPMSSGNIAKRGIEKAEELFHTMPDGTVMPGAVHDNYNYYRNNPHDMTNTELSTMKTEAEMGSSPVQELDTGPFDLAVEDLPLVAKKGPLVRGTYDDYISERDSRARLNSKLNYERMQTRR